VTLCPTIGSFNANLGENDGTKATSDTQNKLRRNVHDTPPDIF
jgi:hypothetical protein